MEQKKTHRVQLELPPQSLERLRQLRDKTESVSYAEVIKNALRLYEAMIDETEQGNTVFLRDKDGQEKVYRLFV